MMFAPPSPVRSGEFDKGPLILNVGWISHPRNLRGIAGSYILWQIRFAARIDLISCVRIHSHQRFEYTRKATLVLRRRSRQGRYRTRLIVDEFDL